jgi:hypothetical protein
MVLRKTYFPLGLPATESEEIFDPALAYVQPLMVSRSGMVFSLTDNDALLLNGGLSLGVLRFGIPFNTGEDIEIVYKTI